MYLDWPLDFFGRFFMWFNFHFYGDMKKKWGKMCLLCVKGFETPWGCYHVNGTVERYQDFVY